MCICRMVHRFYGKDGWMIATALAFVCVKREWTLDNDHIDCGCHCHKRMANENCDNKSSIRLILNFALHIKLAKAGLCHMGSVILANTVRCGIFHTQNTESQLVKCGSEGCEEIISHTNDKIYITFARRILGQDSRVYRHIDSVWVCVCDVSEI